MRSTSPAVTSPAVTSVVSTAIIPTSFRPRLLPECKAVPIELLPLGGVPSIERLVDDLARARVTDIVLVLNSANQAIEDHFDRDLELERRLAEADDRSGLVAVRRAATHPQILSVRQSHGSGPGDAVARVRRHLGREPFLVADPARFVLDDAWLLNGLVDNAVDRGRTTVAVGGDIDLEAPAASDLTRLGRFVLHPEILEALAQADGAADQLGDALVQLHRHGRLDLIVSTSPVFDLTDRLQRLAAELTLSLSDPILGHEVARLVADVATSPTVTLAA